MTGCWVGVCVCVLFFFLLGATCADHLQGPSPPGPPCHAVAGRDIPIALLPAPVLFSTFPETLLPYRLRGPGPVRRGAEAGQHHPPGRTAAGKGPVTGTPRGPTGAAWVSPGAPSRLQRNRTVSEAALRYLWFHISSQAVLRIREVLPEKHPSWKYTQELCQLFDALGTEYSKYRQVGGPWGPPGTPAWPHARTQPRTPLAGVQAPCCLRRQACCMDLGGTRALRAPTRCSHGHEPPGCSMDRSSPPCLWVLGGAEQHRQGAGGQRLGPGVWGRGAGP